MNPAQTLRFYEDLVISLRERGVVCAITSGLACVHYGVAETTKDCDLLCSMQAFDVLFDLLESTLFQKIACRYRGNLSPPLDVQWHRGGWTSHFEWRVEQDFVTLDVFGHAVRQSFPWEHDLSGLYAGMNVVAEMKRTDRDKDWPFITSLGLEMLRSRDPRGWLHLFDADAFAESQETMAIPDELVAARPLLQLAIQHDSKLRPALLAERYFWQELDRFRIRLYRAALRPYLNAVNHANIPGNASLREQHVIRLECAERTLLKNPIGDFGLQKLIEEARATTASLVQPDLLQWLPNVHPHFKYLME